jgi:outer membrane protein TolC
MRRTEQLGRFLLMIALLGGCLGAERLAWGEPGTLETRLGALLGRPGGLTADEVARRARETSFDLRARLKELETATAAVDQALVSYFPRLNLTARYSRLSPLDSPVLGNLVVAPGAGAGVLPPNTPLVNYPFSFPMLLNQTIFQATVAIPITDYFLRILRGHAIATKSEEAASLTAQATAFKVASDARVAYYSWVRARLQVVVAEQALAQARARLADTRHAVEAGVASRADSLRVESLVATSELLLDRARDLADILEDQIRTAMHDPVSTRYQIGEDLRNDPPPLRSRDLAALVAHAQERRLEVKSLEATIAALREQVQLARASYYPRLDALADLTHANPNVRLIPPADEFTFSWSVGVQLTWSPNDLATARTQVRAALARVAQAEAQREQLRDGLRLEVVQAYHALREAEVALRTTVTGLAAAEESYRVRQEQLRNGRAKVVEVVDAETDLTRARLEAVNARIDLRIARERLNHAVGWDVEPKAGG